MDRLATLLLDFQARCRAFSAIQLNALSAEIAAEAASRDLPIPLQLETTATVCCLRYAYPDGAASTQVLLTGREVIASWKGKDGSRWDAGVTHWDESHITVVKLDRIVGAVVDSWLISLDESNSTEPNPITVAKTTSDSGGAMAPKDLAEKHGLVQKTLADRLARYRRGHPNCFIEQANRKPREPQFLYYENKGQSVIADLKRVASA